MRIINILQDINTELQSLVPIPQPYKPTKHYVPVYKIEEIKSKYKETLYNYLLNYIADMKSKQIKYSKVYQEDLLKRKEYVTSTLKAIKNKLDSPEITNIKCLKSQIDFIKSQGPLQFEQIKINEENSLKIFNFLHKMPLENEYEWMEDFLKRKIVFEIVSPSELEIINLRKMVNLIQINEQSSSL